MSPSLIHLLQLALGQIRDHFEAVYDLTIIYEGLTSGGRVRTPPPNLFGKSTKLAYCQLPYVFSICSYCTPSLVSVTEGRGRSISTVRVCAFIANRLGPLPAVTRGRDFDC